MDNIFAYETNGLGSRYVMDDANVPVRIEFGSMNVLGGLTNMFIDIVSPFFTVPRIPK